MEEHETNISLWFNIWWPINQSFQMSGGNMDHSPLTIYKNDKNVKYTLSCHANPQSYKSTKSNVPSYLVYTLNMSYI